MKAFKCMFGFHSWVRVSVQHNGIGFMDECPHCGRGRYLAWAGHASSIGRLSKKQMVQWHEAKQKGAADDR